MRTLSDIKQYCKANQLNFNKAKYAFSKGYSADDACAIAAKGGLLYRHWYHGMPLKHYCTLSGVSYNSVIQKMRKGVDAETAINSYRKRQHYIYDGMTLAEYCKLNNLNYSKIKGHMLTKGFTAREAIERSKEVEEYGRHAFYMVGKITLSKWCKDNGFDYSTMRRKMGKMSFEEAVASYKKKKAKYLIDGESLYHYCKRMHLPYSLTLYRYKKNESIKSGRTARAGLPQGEAGSDKGRVLQPRAGICNTQ